MNGLNDKKVGIARIYQSTKLQIFAFYGRLSLDSKWQKKLKVKELKIIFHFMHTVIKREPVWLLLISGKYTVR